MRILRHDESMCTLEYYEHGTARDGNKVHDRKVMIRFLEL